jgi:hypothetical protein
MLALVPGVAYSWGEDEKMMPPKTPPVQVRNDLDNKQMQSTDVVTTVGMSNINTVDSNSTSDSNASVVINIDNGAETRASGDEGVGAQSTNSDGGSGGDNVSINSSQFYALSLMQPSAVGCFTSGQAGGSTNDMSGGLSGFFGWYKLNIPCWMDSQADQEPDIEINAALRCNDKHYRAALGWKVPKKEQRAECIRIKVASGKAQMVEFNRMLEEMQLNNDLTHERMVETILQK